MTTALDTQVTAALRRAAVRATYAPSVHNTQPWVLKLQRGELNVMADLSRQLHILDPTQRQLTVSVGCALFNARAALAASGFDAHVERFPDPTNSAFIARVTATHRVDATIDPIGLYDSVIEQRQTNRRRFTDDDVPVELVESLERAAADEGSILLPIRTEDARLAVAMLSQRADEVQLLNPAYRAELRSWTTTDIDRCDGVPVSAVPHVDGTSEDEVPIRDFDTSGTGWLPAQTHSSRKQCLLLLGTFSDAPGPWLRAGEALERILLEITRRGFAASPLTQVVEVASARAALRNELGLTWYPHILLRVGRAPLAPASRRRRLVDVLFEEL